VHQPGKTRSTCIHIYIKKEAFNKSINAGIFPLYKEHCEDNFISTTKIGILKTADGFKGKLLIKAVFVSFLFLS